MLLGATRCFARARGARCWLWWEDEGRWSPRAGDHHPWGDPRVPALLMTGGRTACGILLMNTTAAGTGAASRRQRAC